MSLSTAADFHGPTRYNESNERVSGVILGRYSWRGVFREMRFYAEARVTVLAARVESPERKGKKDDREGKRDSAKSVRTDIT